MGRDEFPLAIPLLAHRALRPFALLVDVHDLLDHATGPTCLIPKCGNHAHRLSGLPVCEAGPWVDGRWATQKCIASGHVRRVAGARSTGSGTTCSASRSGTAAASSPSVSSAAAAASTSSTSSATAAVSVGSVSGNAAAVQHERRRGEEQPEQRSGAAKFYRRCTVSAHHPRDLVRPRRKVKYVTATPPRRQRWAVILSAAQTCAKMAPKRRPIW